MNLLKLTMIAAAVSLTACASSPPASTPAVVAAPSASPTAMPQTPAVPPHPYALPSRPAVSVPAAPAWFVNIPPDTADMTFSVGTASSNDEQMAYDKARMAAERKLVEQMYSRISTQTNSFRTDRGQAMIENFQQVTRKNARGELSGAQRVDSQAHFDGSQYKVYVLLRLPLGANNPHQIRRDQQRLNREAEIRGRAAEQDMDRNDAAEQDRDRQDVRDLERRLTPQSQLQPAGPLISQSVPTATGEVQLLDVDNAEYRRRRDETLQKPGAVIGQVTVR